MGLLRFKQYLYRVEQRFILGKSERLKSRKAIDLLFAEGKRVHVEGFRVLYRFEPVDHAAFSVKLGVAAPARTFKRAVDRNRVKRLMREAYRHQKYNLYQKLVTAQKQMAIMWVYKGKTLPELEVVNTAIQKCLEKLSAHL